MKSWSPGDAERGVADKNTLLRAARGCRAFHEFMPLRFTPAEPGRIYRKISYGPLLDVFLLDMRSYRSLSRQFPPRAGKPSARWHAARLAQARTRPLQRRVEGDRRRHSPLGYIGAGDPDADPRRGDEIADLLRFMQRARVRNTMWVTADLHYTAAHYYDPNKAAFQNFEPFWEFVSGPIHAGTWTPCDLDKTFGPRVVYQSAASREQGENLAPCFGLQFFGHVAIDGATGTLTVTLKDVGDRALWSIQIEPKSDQIGLRHT